MIPLSLRPSPLRRTHQFWDSYPTVLNCAVYRKHDIVQLWCESAWISWNTVNVSSCCDTNTHCCVSFQSNTDWSPCVSSRLPLCLPSHRCPLTRTHPVISSILLWARKRFRQYVPACTSATSFASTGGRLADGRVESRPLLLHQNRNRGPTFQFCLPPTRQHTQVSDNYVRVAASSVNRPGKGINTSKSRGIGGGMRGGRRNSKHEVMLKKYRISQKWKGLFEAMHDMMSVFEEQVLKRFRVMKVLSSCFP